MNCRSLPGAGIYGTVVVLLLGAAQLLGSAEKASAGDAAFAFVAPTPSEGRLVISATIRVRLDTTCTFDPATLVVHLNGALLDANAFRPFGPCSDGRMRSQTASVAIARPESQITSGPRRLTVGQQGAFSGTGTGDALAWNFDGAAAPKAGASASATFNAAGKFKVRLRATKQQLLEAAGTDGGNAVSAQRGFAVGDRTPAKRAVRVAMPPDVDFVNYESAQVHPIALDPSGSHLYAVNTPEARLAIFDIAADGALDFAGDVPVGLDPVSLAVRPGTTEVWVANHLSDSVSVVDVAARKLIATIAAGDEPTDIAFASGRAFVTLAGKEDRVAVFRAATRHRIASIDLFGDDPRALATNAAGTEVYAIVLESGNRTTSIFESILTPAGGPPPPSPPRKAALGTAPTTGLIVKQEAGTGHWKDEAGNDWSSVVDYSLPDNDVFVIDAGANQPKVLRTVSGVGTTLFDVIVQPSSGQLWVPNTDARNLVRFAPKLRGHLVETRITKVDPGTATVADVVDLNAHVDFAVTPGPPAEVAESVSQPGNGVFDASGQHLYLTAFGSSKVAVLDGSAQVVDEIMVGGGPSGVALDEAVGRLYVLNRFDNTISIVDTAARAEIARTGVAGPSRFDPSPNAIKKGRHFLYDGTLSGHGDDACASCHVFGNFDNIAWDLGDPQGDFVPYTAAPWTSFFFFGSSQNGFDPQKGPMTTQTLRGLDGLEPFHWRGDRRDFAHFNQAFVELMGMNGHCSISAEPCGDNAECPSGQLCEGLAAEDMDAFRDFIMTVRFPPNPYRNPDDTLPSSIAVPAYDGTPTTGNPNGGRSSFTSDLLDANFFSCADCHSLPTGTSTNLFNGSLELESQDFKIPQLRNIYEKTAFTVVRPGGQQGQSSNISAFAQKKGFGVLHDGSVSLKEFLAADVFTMDTQQEDDMFAFLLAFPTESFPCVGRQVTITAATAGSASALKTIATLISQALLGRCDLIVKGAVGATAKGWVLDSGSGKLQPDSDAEPLVGESDLRAALLAGDVLTYTGVPPGSGVRLGIDRDRDTFLDRSEIAAGTDPADPHSNPWSWSP